MSRWSSYSWRLIRGEPVEPAMNVALDEALTRRVGAGESEPVLRFWGRYLPEVVIGRFQAVSNELDEATARDYGVEVLRRTTGGGAMFVEPPNVITYSLCVPLSLVEGMSTVDSYEFLDRWVVDALREMGVDARYEPINDITSADGKIGGAAQSRRHGEHRGERHGAVLHHTTMAYDMNAEKMLRVLRVGKEKLSDKAVESAEKRVSPIRRQTELPREEVIERMISTFETRYAGEGNLLEDALTGDERAEAIELAAYYGSREWTYSLP